MAISSSGASKSFPGFDHIYYLEIVGDDDWFYADPEPLVRQQPGLLRGEWIPEATLQVYWAMGHPDPEDVALGRSNCLYYLSSKVQQLLKSNGVTGWRTYPIELHNKTGNICPGYAGLSITGRCGPIDEHGGEVVPGQKPGKKYVLRMGLYFDGSTWDGSDFFCPAGENTLRFATEKVKNLFEQHQIEGFTFTPLTKATWYPKAD
jgi:hypothetical protein